ncbi:MAG: BlaI/MecI/CopY family transcriptional regulator [Paraglaciecola sp.]|uniref:BlaI/MecI/CopY family transcriptional regulator n=1 Tax=Paraglaciecola sp. TaxID=1920173 RepID=UPI003298275B
MTTDIKLSEFELDVMNILWQLGKASAPEVHEKIKLDKDVSYSTVKTIIDRLEQKEAVMRAEQQGRTIFYAPAIERETLSPPLLKGFLKRIFAGDPHKMVAQLLDNEQLNNNEIEQLENMLAAHKAKNNK